MITPEYLAYDMELVEDLIEYEGPILSLHKAKKDDQLFLYQWVDVNNPDYYVWYITPVTEEIVEMAKVDAIDQHTLLTTTDDVYLHYIPSALHSKEAEKTVSYKVFDPVILKLLEGHKGLFLHWGDET